MKRLREDEEDTPARLLLPLLNRVRASNLVHDVTTQLLRCVDVLHAALDGDGSAARTAALNVLSVHRDVLVHVSICDGLLPEEMSPGPPASASKVPKHMILSSTSVAVAPTTKAPAARHFLNFVPHSHVLDRGPFKFQVAVSTLVGGALQGFQELLVHILTPHITGVHTVTVSCSPTSSLGGVIRYGVQENGGLTRLQDVSRAGNGAETETTAGTLPAAKQTTDAFINLAPLVVHKDPDGFSTYSFANSALHNCMRMQQCATVIEALYGNRRAADNSLDFLHKRLVAYFRGAVGGLRVAFASKLKALALFVATARSGSIWDDYFSPTCSVGSEFVHARLWDALEAVKWHGKVGLRFWKTFRPLVVPNLARYVCSTNGGMRPRPPPQLLPRTVLQQKLVADTFLRGVACYFFLDTEVAALRVLSTLPYVVVFIKSHGEMVGEESSFTLSPAVGLHLIRLTRPGVLAFESVKAYKAIEAGVAETLASVPFRVAGAGAGGVPGHVLASLQGVVHAAMKDECSDASAMQSGLDLQNPKHVDFSNFLKDLRPTLARRSPRHWRHVSARACPEPRRLCVMTSSAFGTAAESVLEKRLSTAKSEREDESTDFAVSVLHPSWRGVDVLTLLARISAMNGPAGGRQIAGSEGDEEGIISCLFSDLLGFLYGMGVQEVVVVDGSCCLREGNADPAFFDAQWASMGGAEVQTSSGLKK